jgi:peptidoglycan/LPS O-acetylase OafA/YrhL
MNQSERRPDIQGLRGVSVLLVVLYHAGVAFHGGYVGVDAFFVISGFVITSSLRREREATGRVSLGSFYARRVRRLLPASALATAVALLLSIPLAAIAVGRSAAHTGLAALVFNTNTYLALFGTDGGYFGLDAQSNPLLHLWSLSVEEQFYLVFPLLIALCWRRGSTTHRARVAMAACVAVGLLSLLLHLYLAHLHAPGQTARSLAFYLAPARAWEFLAGATASLAVAARSRARGVLDMPMRAVAAALLVGTALWVNDPALTRVAGPALADGATVALLVLGSAARQIGDRNLMDKVLESRVLTGLGDVSYSWYLWHWPLIVFAHSTFPTSGWARSVAALFSLLPAWASTRLVENRFRYRTAMRRPAFAALVAACLLVPAVAAVALRSVSPVSTANVASGPFRSHLDRLDGCDGEPPFKTSGGTPCVYGPDGAGEVLLVGDSNASHFSEAAQSATNSLGLRLRISTRRGCAFVEMTEAPLGSQVPDCALFGRETVDWILSNRPRLVLISLASDLYLSGRLPGLPSTGDDASSPAEARSLAYTEALHAFLTRLGDAGVRAVVIHPIPKFERLWDPNEWSRMRGMLGIGHLRPQMDTDLARDRQRAGLLAEQEALAGTAAVGYDPFDDVCPTDPCSAIRDGIWWYRDGRHISVDASLRLAPRLLDVIRQALEV